MIEFVHRIVCMQLHGFKNQQQKHTLKQCFEETQVKNTPFRLAVPFVVLYTVDIWLIYMYFQEFYISTISYFSNRSCPHAVQDEIIII